MSSQFICQQCGYQSPRWFGKCPECNSWGSGVETVIEQRTKGKEQRSTGKIKEPIPLSSISSKNTSRISTKISEFDRVLGGGLVPGQVILVAGEPGIGKSTILLQLADKLNNFLYVSGEESVNQIKIRADRLGIKNKSISLLEETDVDSITNTIFTFKSGTLGGVVVDSIQTMATSDLSGMAGSVGQVRECAFRLVRMAKSNNIPIFIVGHVTKQGSVAGPSVLMHIVDTVLWFEGDKSLTTRMLRAVKNRFGPTDEVGIFEMKDEGLIPLENPEKLFLSKIHKNISGSIVASVMKGTRPILVEIQSLVVPTKMAFPKRIAQGFDTKRLELLLAVLQRRCGLPLYEFDCFVNITGGINLRNDPSADLAVCMSVASAYFDKPLPVNSLAIGEVGLLGDIREVTLQEKRIKEAKRLGYRYIISNKSSRFLNDAMKLHGLKSVVSSR